MAKVRVAEALEAREPTPEETLLQRARAFVRLKDTVKSMTAQSNTLRDELAAQVEAQGDEDEDGNQWLNLPAEVDGFASLKRERRVSQKLDMDTAVEILQEKGLYDECISLEPTVDEDAIMAAFASGLLSPEEIDRMYPKSVSYAFVPSKKAY